MNPAQKAATVARILAGQTCDTCLWSWTAGRDTGFAADLKLVCTPRDAILANPLPPSRTCHLWREK